MIIICYHEWHKGQGGAAIIFNLLHNDLKHNVDFIFCGMFFTLDI